MILKDEPFRQVEFERRIRVTLLGMQVDVVSPEDLLLSKLIWIQNIQSSLQMEDIKSLKEFPGLDWEYINTWIGSMKLNAFDLLDHE